MGWGVNYTYEGYLSRMSKNQLEDELDTNKKIIADYWRQLLALAAATPPATAKYDEEDGGREYPYAEFLACKLGEIQRELEDYYYQNHHIEDCLEVMREDPDKVTEC